MVVCNFQEKLVTKLEQAINDPEKLHKVFEDSSCEMKSIYSKYSIKQDKILETVLKNKTFFNALRKHCSCQLSIFDELNRPNRWIGTYSLQLGECVKIGRKYFLDPTSVQVYEKTLNIVKNVANTVNDHLTLSKISLPQEIVLEKHCLQTLE